MGTLFTRLLKKQDDFDENHSINLSTRKSTCNRKEDNSGQVYNRHCNKKSSTSSKSRLSSDHLSTINKVPLADKRVSIEHAHDLLMQSRLNALSDLSAAGLEPNLEELSKFTFPFENAVFEGGGVKGISYIGALKCLEDVGIKIKRFAGVSMGASVAGLLSVGYSTDELVPLYVQDLSLFIRDSRCELLCFLPRLSANFGLNPGKTFLEWYGRCLAVKTCDPDVTFRQVYDRFGTELCVVILNMNTGHEEYCHPKTTPNLEVRKAVRMSISVPGVLEPLNLSHNYGKSYMYVDGGVICNYPIYVFDGWWLSMDPKNVIYNALSKQLRSYSSNQLAMLCDLNNRFLDKNWKTIGFKQTGRPGFFNDVFHSPDMAADTHSFSRPNTKLSQRRMKRLLSLERSERVRSMQRRALLTFLQILHRCSNEEGYVNKDQLRKSLVKDELTDAQIRMLFGKKIDLESLVESLPTADNSLISPCDLEEHLKSYGLDMHRLLEASMAESEDITDIRFFWKKLQRNVTNAARRNFIKPEDLTRTVNIHTDYVEFLDFDICNKDQEFLMKQGYKYTLTFLQNFMLQQKEGDATPTSPFEDSISNEKDDTSHIDKEIIKDVPEQPIFYVDDDESYNKWLCTLALDNVSLNNK